MSRKGPHPLSVQIGLAASSQDPETGFVLHDQAKATEDMSKMLLGIQLYQNHPFEAERPPLETVWQAGTATLKTIQRDAKKEEDRPVVLLVPSMVNKAYILDLLPERSLLRFLDEQGINAMLLDWGDGIHDKGQASIEGIVLQRLMPAMEFAAQKTGKKINVLGYCMGGTLLAGAAQFAAKNIASLTFLAAPWDFHAGAQNLLNRVKFWSPSAFPAIAEKGILPMDWMQVLFASLEPGSSAKKFAAFSGMDQGSDEARLFVAVEDWLNDGVDLPGDVAQHCIRDWFFMNNPSNGKWMLDGRTVNPSTINIPTLVIASDKDRLVDYDTAASLAAAIKGAETLNPHCGHIGMIAGSGALKKVWQPIADWVKKHPG